MNSFDPFAEYEQAKAQPPQASKLPAKNAPREIPDDGTDPKPEPPVMPAVPRPKMISAADEWLKFIVKWLVIIFLILLWAWWMFQKLPIFELVSSQVVEKTVQEVPTTTQRQIAQLNKDVNWLKVLLEKSRKQLRVEKENHATTKERLKRALENNHAEQRYSEHLKYALNKFYSEPFKAGEKKRKICFTNAENKKECLNFERPHGALEIPVRTL